MTKPLIIRDTREKASHGWTFPEDAWFGGTVIGTLKTGDYTIQGLEDVLVIERKATVAEWAGNVFQDRFKAELERMQQYKYVYILFEFGLCDLIEFPVGSGIPRQKWPPYDGKVLLRKTLEFQLKYNISMWMCDNADGAEKLAYSLFKRMLEMNVKA